MSSLMRSRAAYFEPATGFNSDDKLTVAILTAIVPPSTLLDDVRKYMHDKRYLRLMDHVMIPSCKSLKDLPALHRSSS